MRQKKFSVSTLILVIVLLGALVGIGSVVNPAPKAPEQPEAPQAEGPAKAAPKSAVVEADEREKRVKEMKKQMEERKKAMEASMKANKKAGSPAVAAAPQQKFDPNTIDVSSTYWDNNQDGEAGIEKNLVKVKAALAEQERMKAIFAKKNKGQPPAPPALPPGAPPGAAPPMPDEHGHAH